MSIDVAAYFERIGYAHDSTATLEVLQEIVLAHAGAIAFENLDPLSGRPVALDPAALEEKIVRRRRGGYCFEHNLLLGRVLEQLDFKITGLAARVLWNASDALATPRSHMLLRVDIGGQPYLVDAGFGGLTLTGVLRLEPHVEQQTPHEFFRVLPTQGEFILQAQVRGEWRTLYSFDLQEQLPVDYEPVNWYLSTHPESKFVNNLIAARSEPGRRHALLNTELAMHETNGPTHRRILANAEELRTALEQEFGLNVPRSAEMDAALERIATSRER